MNECWLYWTTFHSELTSICTTTITIYQMLSMHQLFFTVPHLTDKKSKVRRGQRGLV